MTYICHKVSCHTFCHCHLTDQWVQLSSLGLLDFYLLQSLGKRSWNVHFLEESGKHLQPSGESLPFQVCHPPDPSWLQAAQCTVIVATQKAESLQNLSNPPDNIRLGTIGGNNPLQKIQFQNTNTILVTIKGTIVSPASVTTFTRRVLANLSGILRTSNRLDLSPLVHWTNAQTGYYWSKWHLCHLSPHSQSTLASTLSKKGSEALWPDIMW